MVDYTLPTPFNFLPSVVYFKSLSLSRPGCSHNGQDTTPFAKQLQSPNKAN